MWGTDFRRCICLMDFKQDSVGLSFEVGTNGSISREGSRFASHKVKSGEH